MALNDFLMSFSGPPGRLAPGDYAYLASQLALAAASAAQAAEARDVAIASTTDYPSLAAAEAGSSDGDFFSYKDAQGLPIYAKNIGGVISPIAAPWFSSDHISFGATTVFAAISALQQAVTFPFVALEDLAAGDFISLTRISGTTFASKASASSSPKPAAAFIITDVASGADGTGYTSGLNTTVTVGSATQMAYLSDATPGAFSIVPPDASSTGHIIQPLGVIVPGVGIHFQPQNWIIL